MQSAHIRRFPFPVAIVLACMALVVWADTYTVDDDGPADFTTIQAAIDVAVDGDCINVEPGTYVENIDFLGRDSTAKEVYVLDIDFLGRAITVQSTDGQGFTTIDGSSCTTGALTCSVVTFASNEGSSAVLDGFTVTGGEGTQVGPTNRGGGIFCDGASPTILNCTISGNTVLPPYPGYCCYVAYGGGVSNDNFSSPTLFNCTISGNSTLGPPSAYSYSIGGGMSNSIYSSPTMTECTFSENSANVGGGISNRFNSSPSLTDCTISDNSVQGIIGFAGGGMANSGSSSPTLANCTISGNVAEGYAPQTGTGGGGMANFDSSPILTGCSIDDNSTSSSGGGMLSHFSSPSLTNCTISGNSAPLGSIYYSTGGGGMRNVSSSPTLTSCTIRGNLANLYGGGMSNDSSAPILTNCTISGNTVANKGGGISNEASAPILTNCTISVNSGADGGGMFNLSGGFPSVTNSIFWGDSPDEIESVPGAGAFVNFSDIQGGHPGLGNIDADPLFLDPDGPDDIPGNEDDDYHLQLGSPGIDSGTNSPPGGLPMTDADGNPRVSCGVVDLGAYEAPPGGCAELIRGDSDGNGIFNALADGLHLLTFGFLSGPAPPCLEAAEADGDGMLNALTDSLYLLIHGFAGGPPPSTPYPSCGVDPDPANSLGCDVSVCP